MNKRGINNIIAAILLVLFSILAVGISWMVASNILYDSREEIEAESNLLLTKFSIVRNSINSDGTDLNFLVEKEFGEGEDSFLILLEDSEGNTEPITTYTTTPVNKLERIPVSIAPSDHSLQGELSKIMIYPITRDSEGALITSRAPSDTYKITGTQGTTPPQPPFTDSWRAVYVGNFLDLQDGEIDKLNTLHDSGMNVIIAGSYNVDNLNAFVAKVNSDARLQQYKYVYSMIIDLYDFYFTFCPADSLCDINTDIPETYLDQAIPIIINNPNIFIGYYTFDEPALQGIDKTYQENIYNYIRNQDSNATARPIVIANTMWSLTDTDVDNYMSLDAQDINLIDQYSDVLATQEQWYTMWNNHGLLSDRFMPILPAFSSDVNCGDTPIDLANHLAVTESAISNVLGITYTTDEFGYFAFWPDPKPDFTQGIDNCNAISDDVIAQLQA
jgi:hypothetical protein